MGIRETHFLAKHFLGNAWKLWLPTKSETFLVFENYQLRKPRLGGGVIHWAPWAERPVFNARSANIFVVDPFVCRTCRSVDCAWWAVQSLLRSVFLWMDARGRFPPTGSIGHTLSIASFILQVTINNSPCNPNLSTSTTTATPSAAGTACFKTPEAQLNELRNNHTIMNGRNSLFQRLCGVVLSLSTSFTCRFGTDTTFAELR